MLKSILLVDDSAVIRDVLRDCIQSESGLQVCGEAANGAEAIEKAPRLVPDLIIMDLSMPLMNGLEAAREIKRKMPDVPIILFTQHKGALQDCDARSAGINAIVSKSDRAELLVAEIFNLLTPSPEGLLG
jgi:DNA-binding NarL/FixJ family response regulator